jgi:hypothetical protein
MAKFIDTLREHANADTAKEAEMMQKHAAISLEMNDQVRKQKTRMEVAYDSLVSAKSRLDSAKKAAITLKSSPKFTVKKLGAAYLEEDEARTSWQEAKEVYIEAKRQYQRWEADQLAMFDTATSDASEEALLTE